MRHLPRALLLDFGGVIVDGPVRPTWPVEVGRVLAELLAGAGVAAVPVDVVIDALVSDALPGRARDPVVAASGQRSHEELWGEGIGAHWPAEARRVLVAHAEHLSRCVVEFMHLRDWRLRPGIADCLATASSLGLPMAVVSNAICGAVHREYLASARLSGYFAVELYSDEVGVRKPDPEIVWRAAAALGVPAGDCWFVGDMVAKDVLAARRAGCGAAVLMRSSRVEAAPHSQVATPDVEVADPVELASLLGALLQHAARVEDGHDDARR